MATVSLKALVDKESNKVIFVESGNDFVDVLFSFLTIPIGKVIRLAGYRDLFLNHPPPLGIGCIKNLYTSVENIHEEIFRSDSCKRILLSALNIEAQPHCKKLKLKLEDQIITSYYLCSRKKCLSYYSGFTCPCCSSAKHQTVSLSLDHSQGVFVKDGAKLIVTDDLQVMPLSGASVSLYAKLGVTDATEEMALNFGLDEALNLLMSSLVSKTPLTETLLKDKLEQKLSNVNLAEDMGIVTPIFGDTMNEKGSLLLKLVVSKSKNIVCYAEAGEDFVNFLFNFLTIPLGFIVKKMRECSSSECSSRLSVGRLYKSVQDLDAKYFKSDYHKEVVLNPKLLPGFCYKNSPSEIEEASFYYLDSDAILTTDISLIPADKSSKSVKLEVNDPKTLNDRDENARGFVKEPAVFMVTDNLVVKPISPIFGLSVLKDLNVSVTDIEDRIVHVGKQEALHLLIASFLGDSALTNTFVRTLREPKQEV